MKRHLIALLLNLILSSFLIASNQSNQPIDLDELQYELKQTVHNYQQFQNILIDLEHNLSISYNKVQPHDKNYHKYIVHIHRDPTYINSIAQIQCLREAVQSNFETAFKLSSIINALLDIKKEKKEQELTGTQNIKNSNSKNFK